MDGNGGTFSEASSDGELCLDSGTELDFGDGDFADLTAFLSAEEIHRSLDLALEAFGATLESEDPGPASNPTSQERVLQPVHSPPPENLHTQTKAPSSAPPEVPPNKRLDATTEAVASVGKVARPKPKQPVYKQDKPRLVHEGLELNDRAASATEFCSRAATFIEELSSIFKGSARSEQQAEEGDSSSPDSGYLTPRGQRPAPQGSASAPSAMAPRGPEPQPGGSAGPRADEPPQRPGAPASLGPLSPPCFLHKLKSQEVAEGSAVRLQCRVTGNPPPLVR